jgi:EpsD family peptidyl-prolyl cis-trans isomerase
MIGRFLLPLALIGVAVVAAQWFLEIGKDREPVAAIVNGERISMLQVDHALAQAAATAQEKGKRPRARALERIIDHELLAQEARKANLDRDPRVVHAVEAATRQILGQAYLEQAVSGGQGESRTQVEKFYEENPALFQRRRVYRVLELVVTSPPERLGEIRQIAAAAGSINDIATWLESRRLPFNVATASRPAEHIPLDVLRDVYEMQPGQIAVFPTARGASVVQLLRSNEMPLREAEAAPVIERYLLNRNRLALGLAEISRLRAQARIEYGAEFEPTRAETPAPLAASRPIIEASSRMQGMAGLGY